MFSVPLIRSISASSSVIVTRGGFRRQDSVPCTSVTVFVFPPSVSCARLASAHSWMRSTKAYRRPLLLLAWRRILWIVGWATLKPDAIVMQLPISTPDRIIMQALIGGLLRETRVEDDEAAPPPNDGLSGSAPGSPRVH